MSVRAALIDGIGQLLAAPAPHFIDAPEAGGHVTALVHEAAPPASASALQWLENALGGSADSLLALYRRWDGLRLFADAGDVENCFFFLPIAQMAAEKATLEDWIRIGEVVAPDYEEDGSLERGNLSFYGLPGWWATAVVFAGFGYAPERFFIATEGPYRGVVFSHEHDDGNNRMVARDVDALLAQITGDPAGFMRENYGVHYHDVVSYQPG